MSRAEAPTLPLISGTGPGSTEPAWNSGNFRAYPFHRLVQSQYCEFLMDRKRYLEHRKRVVQVQARVNAGQRRTKHPARELPELYPPQPQVFKSNACDVSELTVEIMDEIARLFGPSAQAQPSCKPFSLNATKKRQESNRIAIENQAIYRRLMSQKSCYPPKHWEENWKLHEERMARISRYPSSWKPTALKEVPKKCSLPPIGKTPKKDGTPPVQSNLEDCVVMRKSPLEIGHH